MTYKNISDCHNHSCYSHDGKDTIDAMCLRAKEIGLVNYTITDHCEIDEYLIDTKYANTVHSAFDAMKIKKEIYPYFLSGIEIAQPLQGLDAVDTILTGRDYDFVIGSIHRLKGMDDLFFWSEDKISRNKAIEQYLTDMVELATWGKADTLAHLTYPLRYITNEDGSRMSFDPYLDIVEKIYKTIIQNGVALELNTSGLRQNIGEVLPNEKLLKMYKDLGGELITIGSDAHNTVDLGKGLQEGFALLDSLGFKYYTVFKQRKATMLNIE